MPRSRYALAALASGALRELVVCGVRPIPAPLGADAAEIVAADGSKWQVLAPTTASARADQAAELQLLPALARAHDDGAIPFDVPRVAGTAALPDGGLAVLCPATGGEPLRIARLRGGPGLAANLGRALGALHELPVEMLTSRGLPNYSPVEYRTRHLAELDEAAQTGLIPAVLLRRWERALEDVGLWRFHPVLVHGDLGPEVVAVAGEDVVAITGWAQARVADPADDLAWVLAAAGEDAAESLMEAYQLRRTELVDLRLVERALLLSELAVTRWLRHGVRQQRQDVVADAQAMLADLAEAIADDRP